MCQRDLSKVMAWLGKDECRLAMSMPSQRVGQSGMRTVLHGPFPSYKRELVRQPAGTEITFVPYVREGDGE
ncbi:hypothetical protein GCM10010909_25190 [Acidocella aquatica]|uniref:Uncharacterized protein n=1 Tax=Acidocella aquatica TaxID=1922313 RepID=A0ABQ6A869_9PROT|nr:hypothetical protein GCM10010909_25190 [Acidocella aquatica]